MNLLIFQTTKGHFGRFDLYQYTFQNLCDSIEPDFFNQKFLSLKVFKDDLARQYDIMKFFGESFKYFIWSNEDARITDDSPVKDYGYYLLTNYLADIGRVYQSKQLQSEEFTYLVEDDSPVIIHHKNLKFYLKEAVNFLKEHPNCFSVHFERYGKLTPPSQLYSADNIGPYRDEYNFQNQVFRTTDMAKVSDYILQNYGVLHNIHTETAVKTAINATFPRAKHCYFNIGNAHSIHIGTSDSDRWINSYKLAKPTNTVKIWE